MAENQHQEFVKPQQVNIPVSQQQEGGLQVETLSINPENQIQGFQPQFQNQIPQQQPQQQLQYAQQQCMPMMQQVPMQQYQNGQVVMVQPIGVQFVNSGPPTPQEIVNLVPLIIRYRKNCQCWFWVTIILAGLLFVGAIISFSYHEDGRLEIVKGFASLFYCIEMCLWFYACRRSRLGLDSFMYNEIVESSRFVKYSILPQIIGLVLAIVSTAHDEKDEYLVFGIFINVLLVSLIVYMKISYFVKLPSDLLLKINEVEQKYPDGGQNYRSLKAVLISMAHTY